jgi:hypothetical protein
MAGCGCALTAAATVFSRIGDRVSATQINSQLMMLEARG